MATEYYFIPCCQLNIISHLVYLLFIRSLFLVFKCLIFKISSNYSRALNTLITLNRNLAELPTISDNYFIYHKAFINIWVNGIGGGVEPQKLS